MYGSTNDGSACFVGHSGQMVAKSESTTKQHECGQAIRPTMGTWWVIVTRGLLYDYMLDWWWVVEAKVAGSVVSADGCGDVCFYASLYMEWTHGKGDLTCYHAGRNGLGVFLEILADCCECDRGTMRQGACRLSLQRLRLNFRNCVYVEFPDRSRERIRYVLTGKVASAGPRGHVKIDTLTWTLGRTSG